mmetsp:Transcript_62046/g.181904  ORF Transcript_62046/g.181904 Transcript_62046/m.181904 type:complete len:312 (-) Transcript_62046:845-1780(-)
MPVVLDAEGADALLRVELEHGLAEREAEQLRRALEATDLAAFAREVVRHPRVGLHQLRLGRLRARDEEVAEQRGPARAHARVPQDVAADIVHAHELVAPDADAERELLRAGLEEQQPHRRARAVFGDAQRADDVLLVLLQRWEAAGGVGHEEDHLRHVAPAPRGAIAGAERGPDEELDRGQGCPCQVRLTHQPQLVDGVRIRRHHHGVRPRRPVGGVVELPEHGREDCLVRIPHSTTNNYDVGVVPLAEAARACLLLGHDGHEPVEVGGEHGDACHHAHHRQHSCLQILRGVVTVAHCGDRFHGPVRHDHP